MSKPVEQQVYDLGFRLAAWLDRGDLLYNSAGSIDSALEQTALLATGNQLQRDLESLFEASFKTFLLDRSSVWTRAGTDAMPQPSDISPAEVNQLMLLINLWGFQLLLGFTAQILKDNISKAIIDRTYLSVDVEGISVLCSECGRYANSSALDDLALTMLRYMPLCVTDGASEFAATRAMFPMTAMLWQLRHSNSAFMQALALMRHISEGRNMRFAGAYSVIDRIPYIARGDAGLLESLRPPVAQVS
jgi:hypothetical protein